MPGRAMKFVAVFAAFWVVAIGLLVLTGKDTTSRFLRLEERLERLATQKKVSPLSQTTASPLIIDYDNIQFVHHNKEMPSDAICSNVSDILRRKELVICALAQDYNPFFQMKTQNGYVGEDIRLAAALGDALGVKVTYKMTYATYEDVINAVHNGEGDIGIAKISYTPERARKVAYSNPYIISRRVILLTRTATTGKENNTLEKVLNTPNAKIAAMKNTCYENFARFLFPRAKITHETEWENGAIAKLKKGKVTAIMRDELRIKQLINSQPKLLLNFMPLTLKGTSDSISVVTNAKEHSLVLFINKFLENEYRTFNINEILNIYKDYIQ